MEVSKRKNPGIQLFQFQIYTKDYMNCIIGPSMVKKIDANFQYVLDFVLLYIQIVSRTFMLIDKSHETFTRYK